MAQRLFDPSYGTALRASYPLTAWHVLVVECEDDAAASLEQGLRLHGHKVNRVVTGKAALQGCADAELVLLNLDLPDIDGLKVCQEIRRTCDVPIIAVTARGTELDRVLGLQAGADDYLVRPYGFRELMARMEAVMRRVNPRAAVKKIVSRGPLRVDADLRTVSLDGRRISVTRKEFDLLYALASAPETVVPRRRLMQQVWGGSWHSRTVDTHVNSLRRKLGAPGWIVTVRGVGFQLGHACGPTTD